MPRRVQDIVPADHRSIRDANLSYASENESKAGKTGNAPSKTGMQKEKEKKEKGEREIPIHRTHTEEARRMPMTPPAPRKPRRARGKKGLTWLLAIIGILVVIAGTAYASSAYFSHATFTIAPRTVPVAVNGTYIAENPAATGTLSYQLISLTGSASTTVPASNGLAVSLKAQGEVTLYNSYSSQAQRLIAGTRLADSSGLIYRLTSSVVIPGSTGSLPGSTVADVIADQPGSSYDISSSDAISDFKIVAFLGTPRYAGIYARLASDVSGGSTGAQKIVDPSLLATTTATLQAEIVSSLSVQAMAMVPSDSIMYPAATSSAFSAPILSGTDPSDATVTVKGTFYGILFKRADLVAKLAPNQTAVFGDFSYMTPGLDSLDFSIANADSFSPTKKTPLIMRLQGSMSLVGDVPVAQIKAKLAGASLAATQNILRGYSPVIDIDHSSGELVPPWSSTVPTDPARIQVVVEGK